MNTFSKGQDYSYNHAKVRMLKMAHVQRDAGKTVGKKGRWVAEDDVHTMRSTHLSACTTNQISLSAVLE